MKHIILLIFIFLITVTTLAGQNKEIVSLVSSYQKKSALKHAQWSLAAVYCDNGQSIIDYNTNYSLAPASGLKLLTTAAALEILGEDFVFKTQLFYEGEITDHNILQGNIIIVGGGDPTLGSDRVDGSLPLDTLMLQWVNAIKKIGIQGIEGSIIADDFLFDRIPLPDQWRWIDIGNYYGAGTSALSIHDNLYYLVFRPGSRIGQAANVIGTEPQIPNLNFVNFMKTGKRGSGDNGYIYNAPGQYNAKLRGTIPAGVKLFKIKGSIPEPALFAAQYLHKKLLTAGIPISNKPELAEENRRYPSQHLIHTTKSPSLKDIVNIINKRSFNLYAEQLIKMMGATKRKIGGTSEGLKIIEEYFDANNISTEGMELYDGSGLSRTNMITTKTIVDLLKFMVTQSSFDSFYKSLSVAGDPDDIGYFNNFGSGTLISNNARIKSGTIEGVRSHSGYLRDIKGRLIAFSFIANNYKGRTSKINQIHKIILLELAHL